MTVTINCYYPLFAEKNSKDFENNPLLYITLTEPSVNVFLLKSLFLNLFVCLSINGRVMNIELTENWVLS